MHQIIHTQKICFSGVIPNTDLLAGSGVEVDPRGAVVVNKVTLSLASTPLVQKQICVKLQSQRRHYNVTHPTFTGLTCWMIQLLAVESSFFRPIPLHQTSQTQQSNRHFLFNNFNSAVISFSLSFWSAVQILFSHFNIQTWGFTDTVWHLCSLPFVLCHPISER